MKGLRRHELRIYSYHITFWILYGIYFYGVNKLDNEDFAWQRLLIYIPAFSLVFYSVYGILRANFSQRFSWRGAVYLLLFYLSFALLAGLITFGALLGTELDLTKESLRAYSFSGFLQTLVVLLSNYTVYAVAYFWMRRSIANEHAKRLVAEEKATALQHLLNSELENQQLEYQSLSQQVSPHFLASVLGQWRGQLQIGQEWLAASMENMHELMVYHMEAREPEHALVPLRRELAHLKIYIALTRQRSRPVYLHSEFAENVAGYIIPPTVLITLVENAFKHGVTDDPQYPVQLQLTMERNEMKFSCRNRINEMASVESHGVGLNNLRRRLAIKYDGRAHLETYREGRDFIARLTIEF